MTDRDRPLELSRDEMTDMMADATDRVVAHLHSLSDQPATDVDRTDRTYDHLREPVPEEPTPFSDLLDRLFEDAIPHSLNTAHPGNFAYIPAGGLFHAAVADFVAAATNRYVGSWHGAPALVRIEATVIEWFCELLGYPEEAFGLLTTGGSMANLIATITARSERFAGGFCDGVVYTSDQAHHSVTKAATLAGFPRENVRSIPTDESYRVRTDLLEDAIETDRTEGRTPFMVVGMAGSTNTGAVDDFDALAEICEREELWLHADAAYGGFFVLTDEGRERLAGISRADSVTLDPHKGLFLPYGTGALLVRDEGVLARTHSADPDYIGDLPSESGVVDFGQLSPELSRGFRGLRVWLPLQMHGLDPFRENLAEKMTLARAAADELREIDHVRVVAEPQLSTLAFRVEPPGIEGEALDDLNRRVIEAVNRRHRVVLSGTTLDGRYALRVSVLSFRTHGRHVEHCIEDVRAAVRDVTG